MIIDNRIEKLRERRERECFSVVNRGVLWYDRLTKAQINELYEWYQNWLDVTITGVIPARPIWLDEKLENRTEEILL